MIGEDVTPVTWHSLWTIEGLVALGTLALAVGTAFLAWRTSRMAGLTEQDVALSRTAIEAAVRPALIPVPFGEFMHPQGHNYTVIVPGRGAGRGNPDRAAVWVQDVDNWLFVSVPVRNEGAGTAFGVIGTLEYETRAILGEASSEQVPPHELSRVSFGIDPQVRPTFADVAEARSVSVRVDYIDLAGNMWASRFTLGPTSDTMNDWRVTEFGGITHRGRIER